MSTEDLALAPDHSASSPDLNWQRRLDALVNGECSEDDFIEEVWSLRATDPDSAWTVVALADQRYRRGQLPAGLYRSLESKIARRELTNPSWGTTIALHPTGVVRPGKSTLEASRVLRDRYVLEGRLGSGGMGTVYQAVDRYRCDLKEGNRRVAIKVLHKDLDDGSEDLSRLRREFYCAQALSHPNIVNVYEFDRDADVAFFTMELLKGDLLSVVIDKARPGPVARTFAWEVIRAVGAALAYAHTRGVVHADLKPQNIMISEAGEVRILDFGASSGAAQLRSSGERAQVRGFAALTPAYACCELLEGRPADPRDDLFALACLAYELLAGEHPFQRRPSTESRDMGLVPSRPPQLTQGQWRALTIGLSWSREGRSIAVSDWLKRVLPQPKTALQAAAARLWPLRAQPLEQPRRLAPAPLAAALLGAVFVLLIAWGTLNRPETHGKSADPAVAAIPEIAQTMPAAAQTPPVAEEPTRGVTQNAPQTAARGALKSAELGPKTPVVPPQAVHLQRNAPARPVARDARPGRQQIFARTYTVRPGGQFAEIHVRRTSSADPTFVWWTEASSAKPAIDYVPQARTTQTFANGSRLVSLFVKIARNATRKAPAVFYVAIGSPSAGTGSVARAQVRIPPSP